MSEQNDQTPETPSIRETQGKSVPFQLPTPGTPIIVKGGSLTVLSYQRLTEAIGPNGTYVYTYSTNATMDIPEVDIIAQEQNWSTQITNLIHPEIIIKYA